MREQLLFLLLWCFLVGNVLAQSKALEQKVQVLQDNMMKKPVMNMNVERWKNLPLGSEFGCSICKAAYEEYTIVANSYRYMFSNSKQLYFALVDYGESPQIFQAMELNSAPIIFHFPAKGAKKKHDQMDFQRSGFGAEAISKFIQERTEINIRVLRPPNYAGPVVILLLVMLVLGLLYMRRDNLDFLYSSNFWGAICVVATIAFTSGQMWNHIRSPPFLMTHPQTRETSFIHGSTQFQLVAETYIVFTLYAVISIGMVLLNDYVQSKADQGKRRVMVFLGIGLVVVFFSLLLSVFRSKYNGYPYSLLWK
ncbi:hypothetical protein M3Y97_00802400 [Aphelenchoides bicaudatus]|nr:hypothetical protein M3Y97_00802400 [Aphelenchoides bicaudatus]